MTILSHVRKGINSLTLTYYLYRIKFSYKWLVVASNMR